MCDGAGNAGFEQVAEIIGIQQEVVSFVSVQVRTATTAEWLDQIPTFGGHSTFAPETLDELLSGTRATIDEIGGSFTMRYAALALTARRTADPAVTA